MEQENTPEAPEEPIKQERDLPAENQQQAQDQEPPEIHQPSYRSANKPEQVNALIGRLSTATKEGRLKWKTLRTFDSYQAKVSGLTINVNNHYDLVSLYVIDPKGESIATAYQDDPEIRSGELRQLWQTARRSAIAVDKRLDELMETMKTIQQEDPVPAQPPKNQEAQPPPRKSFFKRLLGIC